MILELILISQNSFRTATVFTVYGFNMNLWVEVPKPFVKILGTVNTQRKPSCSCQKHTHVSNQTSTFVINKFFSRHVKLYRNLNDYTVSAVKFSSGMLKEINYSYAVFVVELIYFL